MTAQPISQALGRAERAGARSRSGDVLTARDAAATFGRGRVRAQLRAALATARTRRPRPPQRTTDGDPVCVGRAARLPPGLCPRGADRLPPGRAGRVRRAGSARRGARGIAPATTRGAGAALVPASSAKPMSIRASCLGERASREASSMPRAGRPRTASDALVHWSWPAQQRLTRTSDLRDALSRRGPCRHRGVIIESILDAHGGIQSLPEHELRDDPPPAGPAGAGSPSRAASSGQQVLPGRGVARLRDCMRSARHSAHPSAAVGSRPRARQRDNDQRSTAAHLQFLRDSAPSRTSRRPARTRASPQWLAGLTGQWAGSPMARRCRDIRVAPAATASRHRSTRQPDARQHTG